MSVSHIVLDVNYNIIDLHKIIYFSQNFYYFVFKCIFYGNVKTLVEN
jgi:hypothetical protein